MYNTYIYVYAYLYIYVCIYTHSYLSSFARNRGTQTMCYCELSILNSECRQILMGLVRDVDRVLQRVAVCCSVLQCVAVCCSVLQ